MCVDVCGSVCKCVCVLRPGKTELGDEDKELLSLLALITAAQESEQQDTDQEDDNAWNNHKPANCQRQHQFANKKG
jgi:hypothetical protein